MGDMVRGSGLAHGACHPLIAYERGVVGSTGSEGAAGVVRRILHLSTKIGHETKKIRHKN